MTFEEWVDENEGLLVHIAQKHVCRPGIPNHIDAKDLLQEALLTAYRAWDSYDSDKGGLTSYLNSCIMNEVYRLDTNYSGSGRICKDTTIAKEYTPSEKPQNRFSEELSILQRGIKEQLTNRQYEALTAYYGLFGKESNDLRGIGDLLDWSKEKVRYTIQNAEDKLRDWLENHGYKKHDILKLSMEG